MCRLQNVHVWLPTRAVGCGGLDDGAPKLHTLLSTMLAQGRLPRAALETGWGLLLARHSPAIGESLTCATSSSSTFSGRAASPAAVSCRGMPGHVHAQLKWLRGMAASPAGSHVGCGD